MDIGKTATTYEEAKLCPKCGKPGEETKSISVRGMARGTTAKTIYCRTNLCPWENTPWMVQVNPDGSIPPPQDHTGRPKMYSGFEGHDGQAEELIRRLKVAAKAETEKGTEIKNPFSR